jgi:hypothetical protein
MVEKGRGMQESRIMVGSMDGNDRGLLEGRRMDIV